MKNSSETPKKSLETRDDFASATSASQLLKDADKALLHASRHYLDAGSPYEHYEPAYRYGVNWYHANPERHFDDFESDLARGWAAARGSSPLEWHRAKPAVREAWYRISDLVARTERERTQALAGTPAAGTPAAGTPGDR